MMMREGERERERLWMEKWHFSILAGLPERVRHQHASGQLIG